MQQKNMQKKRRGAFERAFGLGLVSSHKKFSLPPGSKAIGIIRSIEHTLKEESNLPKRPNVNISSFFNSGRTSYKVLPKAQSMSQAPKQAISDKLGENLVRLARINPVNIPAQVQEQTKHNFSKQISGYLGGAGTLEEKEARALKVSGKILSDPKMPEWKKKIAGNILLEQLNKSGSVKPTQAPKQGFDPVFKVPESFGKQKVERQTQAPKQGFDPVFNIHQFLEEQEKLANAKKQKKA